MLKEIHENLKDDLAYLWSRDNCDVWNMQLVLRAYGYAYDFESANKQVEFARGEML